MLDLEPIKKREQAATPGPWHATDLDEGGFRYLPDGIEESHPAWHVFEAHQLGNGECASMLEADAEFVASSREDVPALVAEVERLRKAIEECCGYCWNLVQEPGKSQCPKCD